MEPNLKIGDIVIVKNVKEKDLKQGDIISYRQGQSVITHRINKIEKEKNILYRTKGDNNNIEDSDPVTINLIEGKVISRIPFIGKIGLFLRGKVAIIIILISYYIFETRRRKKNRLRQRRRKKRLQYEREE